MPDLAVKRIGQSGLWGSFPEQKDWFLKNLSSESECFLAFCKGDEIIFDNLEDERLETVFHVGLLDQGPNIDGGCSNHLNWQEYKRNTIS